jgi:regulator of nonsense transcripts 1
VITPYRGQVQLIKEMIGKDEELTSMLKDVSLEVSTVDGFQGEFRGLFDAAVCVLYQEEAHIIIILSPRLSLGREKDLIVFSAVRSNRSGQIGFLTDWRRLHVALTRARSALVVVGDHETLELGDRHWAAFAKWCREVQCVQ